VTPAQEPVRVRFAPSPTGSLHLGNALTAVANRRFADERGGTLVLRIDDTDPSRTVAGGEEAILRELEWLRVAWDDGPVRQSERGSLYRAAAEHALATAAAARDPDGSVRVGRVTVLRPDGTATYQLATVVDDLDLGITHVIRGSDHRPNLAPQQAIARAVGGELPEVIHHGLLLGEDGKKLSKRHGHAAVVDLRDDGIPAAAVRAYLEELDLPAHDVRLDLARLHRLAIDAIAAMPNDELAAAAGAPVELSPALRGARTLVEARKIAEQILRPHPAELGPDAALTLERFAELRSAAPERLDEGGARAILRELKAVGGDLKALRRALTGAERGPELWTVVAALDRTEALRRVAL
jgi:glutamyl/glutaminyl-tRNA synthetase